MFATSSQNPTPSNLNPTLGTNIAVTSSLPAYNTGANVGGNFNTMQNLFATGVQNPQPTGYSNFSIPTAVNYQTGTAETNNNNFYSMHNLFATGSGMQNQGVTLSQPQSVPSGVTLGSTSTSGADNFNTLQNLFATSSNMMPVQSNPTVVAVNQPVPNL